MGKFPYKVIKDYMGNFNEELPNNYFDFVFSISALEHVEQENQFSLIVADINRVLKNDGFSAHLLDVVFKPNGNFWTNKIANVMFEQKGTLNKFISPEVMVEEEDLYCMCRAGYVEYWEKFTNKSYDENGHPSSLNVFWGK